MSAEIIPFPQRDTEVPEPDTPSRPLPKDAADLLEEFAQTPSEITSPGLLRLLTELNEKLQS